MHNNPAPSPSGSRCRRCGTCCRKGGPALHLADQELVTTGQIPLKHLFTIRQGEPAFDNIRRVVIPAPTDIIKIKGRGDNGADCRYFASDPAGCGIYTHRPLECRILACWDTDSIQRTYAKERLTRAHLLVRLPELADLVGEHQEHCDYGRIAALTQTVRQHPADTEASQTLSEIIRYDISLRQVTIERTRLDAELLDFLFGLPLTLTLKRGRP